ncbi:MAG TPA: glycoside hydrolase family 3 N-terminal domain-containing protein [Aggregatilinea sp.]|uniref:glycoside hydrolase family 3 N-terminal domain-containing protein n=1 Tax=Aggregatilinea sp. TaxID=2806333 RepID=UPI002C5E73C8|nr:glycoside hydrolase family 3 N-terminal domain-containing protein [Aggregatilinea sp.]HML20332.1 glycoside hydrolase family 3 N-terminal domain-containing protein [Aggregatilinea sp.]
MPTISPDSSALTPAYRNPTLTVEERVADLLGRMTLEEKVGQLMLWDARSEDLSFITTFQPGSLLHILGEKISRAIDLAAQNRLGIPLLVGEDAIHGHSFWKGATIFPTQLALACSWNPELLEQVGRVTAEEMVPTGIHWTFSPVLCLTRDLRWGRTGETFGEDPYLIGELGAALIRGYQGRGLDDPAAVLATAKHYAGYSETQGGRDASEADLSRRKLRSYFLPPFERAARAGAMTFMTGYQSMDGVPSTANRWLLTEVLKDEWGFRGVVVTDWDNVGRLVREQKVCATYADAAIVALRAGNDIMMTTPEFYEGAIEAVRSGRLAESEIDAPCARLLALKFRMGLFEDPRYPDLDCAAAEIARPDHRAINLTAARQSLVLLQNNGLLPLDPAAAMSIAVIGPNADDDLQQLGDWSLGASQHPPEAGKQPREKTTTVLDGIRALAPAGSTVRYERGCSIFDDDLSGIPAAVAAADAADVVVVVVGDHLKFMGETQSTATLELQGGQIALLDALEKTGKPLVVVLVNSKPLVLPPTAKRAAAIVELFNPGMEGGRALAEALFGQLNPSGKVTISFPVHVGQQPVFYSQVRGQHGDRYADLTQEPLFSFGHGLSYTQYRYSNLRLDQPTITQGQAVTVSVDMENTGQRAGDEIVQVYVSDVVTSVTWVNKALKGFARVHLAPGEQQTVQVSLPWEALQIVDAEAHAVVEPGEFEILVGPSSRDEDLLKATLTVE